MIKNKKGLSTVVTTLIIILLVLVAVGIIWIVVRGIIETGADTVDYSVKCLEVDVRATAVTNCAGDPVLCDVTLERKAGGENIAGVMLVFRDTTGASTTTPVEISGNIEPLTTSVELSVNSGLTDPERVEVTAYFENTAGEKVVCTQTNPFAF